MISKKFIVALFVSLMLAVSAALLANRWLSSLNETQTEASIITKPVLVAANQIPYGDTIESHHVTLKDMPIEYLPEGYLSDLAKIEGAIAKRDLIAGEVILPHHFIEPNNGNILASLLEKNMRAVTVRVNDVVGVAGFLMPGNYVDVVSAVKQNKSVKTDTVLERIKVLAVDQKANADESKGPTIVRSVTLGVTPKQAELLVKVRTEGQIQLTLRNPNEDVEEKIIADAVKPRVVKPVARRVAPRRATSQNITIIRGVESEKKRVSL
jgi:pilus assembly protein CpaB